MRDRFREHLGRALACIAREVPSLGARLAEAVGPRVIEIEVDGAPFWVGAEGGAVTLRPSDEGVVAWGSASAAAIDDLLEGRDTIEGAVLEGRVHLRGDLEDLVALDRALRVFVQCAVRSPGILSILASWRGSTQGDPG